MNMENKTDTNPPLTKERIEKIKKYNRFQLDEMQKDWEEEMGTKKPKPIGVGNIYDVVEVEFDDGVTARFTPYSHGMGYQIEGLHSVEYIKDGKRIFVFNSRLYRCGPQPTEHKIVKMEGITQEQAAEYWESAKEYVTKLFEPNGVLGKTDDTHWYHWRVLTEGGFDLKRLKEGKAEIMNTGD